MSPAGEERRPSPHALQCGTSRPPTVQILLVLRRSSDLSAAATKWLTIRRVVPLCKSPDAMACSPYWRALAEDRCAGSLSSYRGFGATHFCGPKCYETAEADLEPDLPWATHDARARFSIARTAPSQCSA